MTEAQGRAVKILSFYFRTCWEAQGLRWTEDNQSEIESLVDDLTKETI